MTAVTDGVRVATTNCIIALRAREISKPMNRQSMMRDLFYARDTEPCEAQSIIVVRSVRVVPEQGSAFDTHRYDTCSRGSHESRSTSRLHHSLLRLRRWTLP